MRALLEELLGREYVIARLEKIYEDGNRGIPANKRMSRHGVWEAMEGRRRALHLINGEEASQWIKERDEEERKQREVKEKTEKEAREKKEKERVETLKKQVLGKEINGRRLEELSQPKDKWLTGKTMKSLQHDFPHDRVLEKMIKEEFRENRVFRYPDEYEVYDEEEEARRKKKSVRSDNLYTLRDKKKGKQESVKANLEKWLIDEQGRQRMTLRDLESEAKKKQAVEGFIANKAKEYLEMRKNRLEKKGPTEKQFLAEAYQQLRAAHPEQSVKEFPLLTYGMNKKRAKRTYPP